MGNLIWRGLHAQRLALNMFWCAFLLWPWGTLPRETVSGFFGRKAETGAPVACWIARAIDWIHPNEPFHCQVTANMERAARVALCYHP